MNEWDTLPGDAQDEYNALRAIVRAVAAIEDPDYLDGLTCIFRCGAGKWEPHTSDCPVTKARVIFADKSKETSE